MRYRPEIDGLRAIAVTAVIAAHAGVPLSGGFLGVDIFFVISGFLITQILVRDLEQGQFSLTRFYERRARRILPALIVVCTACVPIAWAVMSPDQLRAFGQSLVALGIFGTNILFWWQAGYFAPTSEEIPLLHTWSLAVEEQFYVLFPLALMVLWRWRKGPGFPVFAVLAGVALISLAMAETAARLWPDTAFYWLPFRAWELLAGALAALAVTGHGPDAARLARWGGPLAMGGLVLIAASQILYHPWLPIPGIWLLVPVGGTVLVLVFGTEGTLACRILALRPAVAIGLISYSAYLWHQPLLAFARLGSFDPPGPWMLAGLVALTFLLAWATWAWVEQPCRRRVPLWPLVAGTAGAGAALAAFGLTAHLAQGLGDPRFTPAERALLATATPSPKRAACHGTPLGAPRPEAACIYFADASPGWAVLGDSHAVELAYGLAEHLTPTGESLVHLSASGCPPAFTFASSQPGCADWIRRSVDWLATRSGIHTVVLIWRHSAYLHGQNSHDYPRLPDTPYKIAGPGDAAAKRASYWEAMAGIVTRLKQPGRRVILVAPVPEIARHIDKYTLFRHPGSGPVPTVSRAYYEARNHEALAGLDRLKGLGAELHAVAPLLCDAKTCYGSHDGEALYFDDDHLSLAGARLVTAPLVHPSLAGWR
ncbi:MAG: acyltransferase family protein [Pseudomonadota bacterium]